MTDTDVGGVSFPDSIAAMLFDTGGTVFDWHSAIPRALEGRGSDRGITADRPAVTKTWRTLSTTMVDAGLPQAGGRATAFVYRPREWSDIRSRDPEPGDAVAVVARDLDDLARQSGLGLADRS